MSYIYPENPFDGFSQVKLPKQFNLSLHHR